MTPEWMIDRETVPDELEDTMGDPPFDSWKLIRGQSRGKANMFAKTVTSNKQVTGIVKDIIKIKEKHMKSAEVDDDLKEFMSAKK